MEPLAEELEQDYERAEAQDTFICGQLLRTEVHGTNDTRSQHTEEYWKSMCIRKAPIMLRESWADVTVTTIQKP